MFPFELFCVFGLEGVLMKRSFCLVSVDRVFSSDGSVVQKYLVKSEF